MRNDTENVSMRGAWLGCYRLAMPSMRDGSIDALPLGPVLGRHGTTGHTTR